MFSKSPPLFRKNDYENTGKLHKPLAKSLSLFKPVKQEILTPGSCSLGPYLKQSTLAKESLYYLAPHNLIEYFASEILLRIGILTPKCRVLSWQDEEIVSIPYELMMITLDENKKIDNARLYEFVSSRGYRPLLIKKGKQILLFGTPNASQWEITALQSEVFSHLKFREPGDLHSIIYKELVTPKMYKEIISKKAHMPPVIASKSIAEFIPIHLVRRFSRSGIKLGYRHFDYLHGKSKELQERYELDIVKQVIHDHTEKKTYRISGNLFGSDIAALLICDYDFQSDGSNFGIVKEGSRFYAVAIDKEAVRFEGKSYEMLAKKLSDRFIDDILYKSRMDEQIMAVVYQIAQALVLDNNKQCAFDKIFSNPRVQATHQLFISPDERCVNIKKTAFSIVAHYEKIYGDNFLEKYSEREKIRMQIANQVLENFDFRDNSRDFEMIKNNILEDLRGPYYAQLFSDQEKRLISKTDIDNKTLLMSILTDVSSEYDFSNWNENMYSPT
jgi:hypothetical protein